MRFWVGWSSPWNLTFQAHGGCGIWAEVVSCSNGCTCRGCCHGKIGDERLKHCTLRHWSLPHWRNNMFLLHGGVATQIETTYSLCCSCGNSPCPNEICHVPHSDTCSSTTNHQIPTHRDPSPKNLGRVRKTPASANLDSRQKIWFFVNLPHLHRKFHGEPWWAAMNNKSGSSNLWHMDFGDT